MLLPHLAGCCETGRAKPMGSYCASTCALALLRDEGSTRRHVREVCQKLPGGVLHAKCCYMECPAPAGKNLLFKSPELTDASAAIHTVGGPFVIKVAECHVSHISYAEMRKKLVSHRQAKLRVLRQDFRLQLRPSPSLRGTQTNKIPNPPEVHDMWAIPPERYNLRTPSCRYIYYNTGTNYSK